MARGKPKKYSGYNPLFVYTEEYIQTTLEEAIRQNESRIRDWERRHFFDCAYKTKTTKAGRMLEVDIYPAFLNRKDYSRALKAQKTGAAQQKQNDKNAQRKLIRIIQKNFVPGDIAFGAGYPNNKQPETREECEKDIRNFFDVLQYHSRKAGAGPIKYVYVIEETEDGDGNQRFHVHMVMSRNAGANTSKRCEKCGKVYSDPDDGRCSGLHIPARATKAELLATGKAHRVRGLRPDMTKAQLRKMIHAATSCGGRLVPIDPRDWIESKWKGGEYENTKRLQWNQKKGGFTGISKYMTKQFEKEYAGTRPPGRRRWGQSLGLLDRDGPPKHSFDRFKKSRVMKMLKAPATMKEVFEREYPGYEYLEDYPCEVRYSDAVEGFYLYCRMYKRE